MKRIRHILICISVALFLLLFTASCSEKQPMKALSEKELAEANQWFSGIVEENQITASCISCFFTSYYSDPREIDLMEFLKYCPVGEMLTDADAEEFRCWAEAAQWPDPEGKIQKPSEFYVPVRRLANSDVSAILMQYAGITTADLESYGSAVYLEKYDAFYNFTSDFAPGHFACVGGETDGRVVRFWSDLAQDGTREILTLELVDEQYLIRSFLLEQIP